MLDYSDIPWALYSNKHLQKFKVEFTWVKNLWHWSENGVLSLLNSHVVLQILWFWGAQSSSALENECRNQLPVVYKCEYLHFLNHIRKSWGFLPLQFQVEYVQMSSLISKEVQSCESLGSSKVGLSEPLNPQKPLI